MQTVQINPARFNYEPTVQVPRQRLTLNDYRLFPANYSAVSSLKPDSMRPVFISVLIASVVAGTAIGIHRYNESSATRSAVVQEATPAATTPLGPAADTVTAPATPAPAAEIAPAPVVAPAQSVAPQAATPAPTATAAVSNKSPATAPRAARTAVPPSRATQVRDTPAATPVMVEEPTSVPPPAPVVEPKPVTLPSPSPADPPIEPPKS